MISIQDKLRFESKFIKGKGNECWLWQAAVIHNGYGQFTYKYKGIKAHRFSYELYKGEIPKGMLVCHSCDVRNCVNPDHLWLGTQKDNIQDMFKKGRRIFTEEARKKIAKRSRERIVSTETRNILRKNAIGNTNRKGMNNSKQANLKIKEKTIEFYKKNKNTKKICSFCGNDFMGYDGRPQQLYCSTKCNNKSQRQKRSEKRLSKRIAKAKMIKPIKNCKFCDKEFVGSTLQLHCSKLCCSRQSDKNKRDKLMRSQLRFSNDRMGSW